MELISNVLIVPKLQRKLFKIFSLTSIRPLFRRNLHEILEKNWWNKRRQVLFFLALLYSSSLCPSTYTSILNQTILKGGELRDFLSLNLFYFIIIIFLSEQCGCGKKKVNAALSTITEIILSGQGRKKHLDLLGTSHEGTSITERVMYREQVINLVTVWKL